MAKYLIAEMAYTRNPRNSFQLLNDEGSLGGMALPPPPLGAKFSLALPERSWKSPRISKLGSGRHPDGESGKVSDP